MAWFVKRLNKVRLKINRINGTRGGNLLLIECHPLLFSTNARVPQSLFIFLMLF